jgi:hypothetical protein
MGGACSTNRVGEEYIYLFIYQIHVPIPCRSCHSFNKFHIYHNNDIAAVTFCMPTIPYILIVLSQLLLANLPSRLSIKGARR